MSGSQGFSLPIRVVEAGGVSVWLVEDHAVPVVSLSWSWRGGAALDLRDDAFELITVATEENPPLCGT